MRLFGERGWAGAVSAALIVGLLPATAVATPLVSSGVELPELRQPPAVAVKDMRFGREGVRADAAARKWAAPKVAWPHAGTETVDVGTTSKPRRAKGLPVSIAATSRVRGAAERALKVKVSVADRGVSGRAGVEGIVFSVARADSSTAAGATRVTVSYDAFRGAYGGDWATRLRLVQLPACALATPEKPSCRSGKPLTTENNTEARTLSADVSLAPAPGTASNRSAGSSMTVLAATAGDSGPTGNFKASSLQPSGSWSAGGSTGAFNWSYPISAPGVPGGLQPSISLNYNSQSVDGRTAASNSQPSWIGDGWDWNPGYIERRYKPCEDDKTGGTNTTKVGDLCWYTNNAVLSLDGKTTDLVFDTTKGWHAASDAAEKVEKLTGAANQDAGTAGVDGAGEHWRITTADGTQYFFGRNKLPGWQDNGTAADDPLTNSAWNVPVFGNHSGEPCYNASFASAWCQQTWRWNLDYVVDPRGNAMAYYWKKDANHYGRNVSATGVSTSTPYDRGGSLERIEYGLDGTAPYRAKAMAKVNFGIDERCLSSCGTFDATNAKNWPDVPFDLYCKDAATVCTGNYSPSFWSRTRLKSISTQILTGGIYKDVDSWALQQSFPPGSGDGISTPMWLDTVTRTGKTGATPISLPPVTFKGVQKPNRVDVLGDGLAPFIRQRMSSIVTETGGAIGINYLDPECTPTTLPPADGTNTTRCYPVKWTFEGDTARTDWFNSYAVHKVIEDDNVLATPNTLTEYTYVGGAKWAKSTDEFTKAEDLTYSVARGYHQVQTRKGDASTPKTFTESRYFRGIDGDQVKDSAGIAVTDREQFAGMLRESATYNGVGGPLVTATSYTPWRSGVTATRTRPAAIGDLKAYHIGTEVEESRTKISTGERKTRLVQEFDAYGMVSSSSFLGDLQKAGDETCAITSYARNTSANILSTVSRVEKLAADCNSTSISRPGDVIDDVRTSYDGAAFGTVPSKGLVTSTERINGQGTGYDRVSSIPSVCGPDGHQLCFDRYGRPLAKEDAAGEISYSFPSPAEGQVPTSVVVKNPLQHAVTTELDPLRGQPTQVTDANGNVTSTTYDALGRVDKVWTPTRAKATYPNGPNVDFDYLIRSNDASVVTKKVLDHNSEYQTTYEFFDGLLRPRQSQSKSPDNAGSLVAETFYNSRGEAWLSSGVYFTAQQPSTTLVTGQETKYPASTESVFDGAGRTTAIISKRFTDETKRTTTTYTGDTTTVVPPAGGTAATTVIDALGRTTELKEYAGAGLTAPQSTHYRFNKHGRLDQITDASQAVWSYAYDVRGRQTQADDPDKGTTKTAYDKADRTVDITTERPNATSTTLHTDYDELGRRTALKKGTSTLATWMYDTVAKGLPTKATRYDNGNAYTSEVTYYDELGRAVGNQVTIPDVEGRLAGTYEWFDFYNENTSKLMYTELPAMGDLPAETITYSYNTGGHLSGHYAGSDPLISDATYDHYGRNIRREHGKFAQLLVVTNEYDDHTSNLTHTYTDREAAPQRVEDTRYTYDPAGNITQLATAYGQDATRTTDTQCFTLDALRRITEAWTNTGETCATAPSDTVVGGQDAYWTSYTYNAVGNRRTETQHKTPSGPTSDTIRTYAAPTQGKHDLPSVTQTGSNTRTETYTYDDNGNTKTRKIGNSDLETFAWDDEGHLKSVTKVADTTSYLYDTAGQRLIRRDTSGTTLYLPGGNELHLDKAGTTVTGTRYYGSTAMRTGGKLTFNLTDHHGTSTTQISADAAQSITRRKTTIFGAPRGSEPTGWQGDKGFIGGTKDPDTALTHIGAREYDPNLGRFISVDPLLTLSAPQSLNGYGYANNNPVTTSDPTGLCAEIDCPTRPCPNCENTTPGKVPGPPKLTPTGSAAANGGDLDSGNNDTSNNDSSNNDSSNGDDDRGWWEEYGSGLVDEGVNFVTGLKDTAVTEFSNIGNCVTWDGTCKEALSDLNNRINPAEMAMGAGEGILARGSEIVSDFSNGKSAEGSAKITFSLLLAAVTKKAIGCRNSFVPGTLVVAADGRTIPIEDLKVGDKVLATDPETGETVEKAVTDTIIGTGEKNLVSITIDTDGATGNDIASVTATDGHPFWVPTLHAWIDATKLAPGQWLRTSAGTHVQITAVKRWTQQATVHNLTVANIHTYYVLAGQTPVLVHNCNPVKDFNVPNTPGVYTIHLKGGEKYVGMSTTNIQDRVTAATKPSHAVGTAGYSCADICNVTWMRLPAGVKSVTARRVEQTVMEGLKSRGVSLVNRRDPEFDVTGLGGPQNWR
ncbi:polymorphic toxin-type HINT domain-containing protein [Streptomyces sp. NPDC059875]|uniref:polymorphic toxin-type HINT domain-containing protein n=1 Tax=unclassified Streptomyces TaxID=2593676 RepID=UPI00365AB51C